MCVYSMSMCWQALFFSDKIFCYIFHLCGSCLPEKHTSANLARPILKSVKYVRFLLHFTRRMSIKLSPSAPASPLFNLHPLWEAVAFLTCSSCILVNSCCQRVTRRSRLYRLTNSVRICEWRNGNSEGVECFHWLCLGCMQLLPWSLNKLCRSCFFLHLWLLYPCLGAVVFLVSTE